MQDKNGKLGVKVAAQLSTGLLDVLLELADGVLERGAGVVDLVDDEHALADEVGHLAEGREVEPLGAQDLGAGRLDRLVGRSRQLLVQRQADRLDRNVGPAGLLEERAQDARRHVTAPADGDHQLGVELFQDPRRRLLAQLVHLYICVHRPAQGGVAS